MKHEHKWVKIEILGNEMETCPQCGAMRDAEGKIRKAIGLRLKGEKK